MIAENSTTIQKQQSTLPDIESLVSLSIFDFLLVLSSILQMQNANCVYTKMD